MTDPMIQTLLDEYPPEDIIRAVATRLQSRSEDIDSDGDGSSGYVEAANKRDAAISTLFEAAVMVEEAFG